MLIDPDGLTGRGGSNANTIGKKGPQRGSNVGVFGCLVGCLGYAQGDSEPQASLQPTIGGGIEICEKPKPKSTPKPEENCDMPKPKDCGIYDPNCNDQVQPPGLPIPTRFKAGLFIGMSMKSDGRICMQFGLFGAPPIPLPSLELGGISE